VVSVDGKGERKERGRLRQTAAICRSSSSSTGNLSMSESFVRHLSYVSLSLSQSREKEEKELTTLNNNSVSQNLDDRLNRLLHPRESDQPHPRR